MARLIDIDALRDYWRISEPCERCHWNKIDCSKPPYYSLLDICNAIDEMPTIDAIPVEWIKAKMDKEKREADKCIGNAAFTLAVITPMAYLMNEWRKEQEANK